MPKIRESKNLRDPKQKFIGSKGFRSKFGSIGMIAVQDLRPTRCHDNLSCSCTIQDPRDPATYSLSEIQDPLDPTITLLQQDTGFLRYDAKNEYIRSNILHEPGSCVIWL